MINCKELKIGSLVYVNGEVREVCAITKKKIGYHICENESRIHYCRLHDVEPISIESVAFSDEGLVINGSILLNYDVYMIDVGYGDNMTMFKNRLGEGLMLKSSYIHVLQSVLDMLFLPKTVKFMRD